MGFETVSDAMGYFDDAPPGLLFRNVWLMGANAVFQTPEGSDRKAHSIGDCLKTPLQLKNGLSVGLIFGTPGVRGILDMFRPKSSVYRV